MYLAPEVVPEVFAQYFGSPPHKTSLSPSGFDLYRDGYPHNPLLEASDLWYPHHHHLKSLGPLSNEYADFVELGSLTTCVGDRLHHNVLCIHCVRLEVQLNEQGWILVPFYEGRLWKRLISNTFALC